MELVVTELSLPVKRSKCTPPLEHSNKKKEPFQGSFFFENANAGNLSYPRSKLKITPLGVIFNLRRGATALLQLRVGIERRSHVFQQKNGRGGAQPER